MSYLNNKVVAEWKEVVASIRRLLSVRPNPVVVALDGGTGAGKSTLASLLENEIDTAVIPLDDFFSAEIPDSQWDNFTLDERLNHVFDLRRLRRDAIEPLLSGRPAKWRAFDFQSGLRPDGTYRMKIESTERMPATVILIDGAYSAHPDLADLIDLSILIEVPVEERHARLAAREDSNFLTTWHQRWDPVEWYYFNEVRPRSSFDLVVKGVSRA